MSRSPTPVEFYQANGYCREESVGYLMRRITMSIIQQADKRLGEHGLTSAQWGPLMRLQTVGGDRPHPGTDSLGLLSHGREGTDLRGRAVEHPTLYAGDLRDYRPRR